MKRSFTIFSIGLNLALLAALVFCAKNPRFHSQPKKAKAARDSQILVRQTQIVVSTNHFTADAVAKFNWSAIESEDYPAYIANLRAVRCPEKTIFDVLFADIEKLFAERKAKLETPDKFWLTGDDLEKARLAKINKLLELQEEKRALIQALLHSELDWEMMHDWYEEKELGLYAGFLSDSQAERALSVVKKFGDRIEAVGARAGSLLIPEDAEEKKKWYAAMRSALGGIISAGELEEAELRLICLLSYLFSNNDLKDSKLTGPELRQITQLQLRLDNPLERELIEYNGEDSTPEELSKQNFLQEVKKFLGEVRFQQFLRAHDKEFEQLCQLTEQNGLRSQIAMGVYEIQQVALLESSRIREDRSLRRKEQRLELESFEQSTRDAVQQLLGEKASANYATNGGNWLKELKKP